MSTQRLVLSGRASAISSLWQPRLKNVHIHQIYSTDTLFGVKSTPLHSHISRNLLLLKDRSVTLGSVSGPITVPAPLSVTVVIAAVADSIWIRYPSSIRPGCVPYLHNTLIAFGFTSLKSYLSFNTEQRIPCFSSSWTPGLSGQICRRPWKDHWRAFIFSKITVCIWTLVRLPFKVFRIVCQKNTSILFGVYEVLIVYSGFRLPTRHSSNLRPGSYLALYRVVFPMFEVVINENLMCCSQTTKASIRVKIW